MTIDHVSGNGESRLALVNPPYSVSPLAPIEGRTLQAGRSSVSPAVRECSGKSLPFPGSDTHYRVPALLVRRRAEASVPIAVLSVAFTHGPLATESCGHNTLYFNTLRTWHQKC